MRTSSRCGLWAAVCVAGLGAVPLRGQDADRSLAVRHRNECRLAAQVVSTGHPRTKAEWAKDYLLNCEEDAPPVLAGLWRDLPADTGRVEWLVAISSRIRDGRIYDQARTVALDRSRPDVVRVGAMIVLAQYADPYAGYSLAVLAPPPEPVRRVLRPTVGSTYGVQLRGPIPITGPVDDAVRTLLAQVAETDPSRPVWYAAGSMAHALGSEVRRSEVPPRD